MCKDEQATDNLRKLLDSRKIGRFISAVEGKRRTKEMIARKREEHGLKSH